MAGQHSVGEQRMSVRVGRRDLGSEGPSGRAGGGGTVARAGDELSAASVAGEDEGGVSKLRGERRRASREVRARSGDFARVSVFLPVVAAAQGIDEEGVRVEECKSGRLTLK